MLSVFDRIKQALTDNFCLSKTDLFDIADIANTSSNRAMFQILIQNEKLIGMGKGRGKKYYLPPNFVKPVQEEGVWEFKQKGDGVIILIHNDEKIDFQSYDECALYIKRRFTNG